MFLFIVMKFLTHKVAMFEMFGHGHFEQSSRHRQILLGVPRLNFLETLAFGFSVSVIVTL